MSTEQIQGIVDRLQARINGSAREIFLTTALFKGGGKRGLAFNCAKYLRHFEAGMPMRNDATACASDDECLRESFREAVIHEELDASPIKNDPICSNEKSLTSKEIDAFFYENVQKYFAQEKARKQQLEAHEEAGTQQPKLLLPSALDSPVLYLLMRFAEAYPLVSSLPKKRRRSHQRWGCGNPDPEPELLCKVDLTKLRNISDLAASTARDGRDQDTYTTDQVLDTFRNLRTGRLDQLVGYVAPQSDPQPRLKTEDGTIFD